VRYYEDFAVGESRLIGHYQASREEIIAFAREWDPQPFHTDEAAANASVFGGLTGSSCHTYAIAAKILHRNPEKVAVLANLATELRFPEPLRPDERLTQTSECVDKRLSHSRPGTGVVTTLSRLTNPRGGVVLEMKTVVLMQCRETTADD
jgi:acyl dehydratase